MSIALHQHADQSLARRVQVGERILGSGSLVSFTQNTLSLPKFSPPHMSI